MSDDSQRPQDGADGWIDPYAATEFGLEAVQAPPEETERAVLRTAPPPVESADAGKPLALLSHASVLLGLPLFVIPMMQRDNEFALHHAKAAAVNFIIFWVFIVLTMVSCGLAFPLIFICYIPMLIGFINAANGYQAGTFAFGGAGERLFPNLRIKEDPQLLE